MTRYSYSWILCLLSAVAVQITGAQSTPDRPNVLFITIDDLRPALGCYDDFLAKSPHIDRLAATARVFKRAYCQQAVCGPSRASLLTGRLPENIGVWHNRNLFRRAAPDLVTLPQLFKIEGWQVLGLGKIFSGDTREDDPPSWSVPAVLRGEGWKNYALSGRADGKGPASEAADVDDEGYPDGRLARLAVETLEELRENAQPFFLAVGFFKPHLPFNAPKKYWDLHDPVPFATPAQASSIINAPAESLHSHRELGGYEDMPKDERLSAEQTRHLRHGYYACVSYVDAQVGKLLDALDQLGLAHNTIVVLWGDHGFALGEQERWCKGTNFELDTLVPLLIRTPGMKQPGAATDALVELVDIYPTLTGLAGLTAPPDLDGRSLQPLLDDPQAPGREAVFSQFARPFSPNAPQLMGYSIRTDTHRYTRWVTWPDKHTTAEELYDYKSDLSIARNGGYFIERQNIVAETELASTRKSLSQRLDQMLVERLTLDANADSVQVKKKRKKKELE